MIHLQLAPMATVGTAMVKRHKDGLPFLFGQRVFYFRQSGSAPEDIHVSFPSAFRRTGIALCPCLMLLTVLRIIAPSVFLTAASTLTSLALRPDGCSAIPAFIIWFSLALVRRASVATFAHLLDETVAAISGIGASADDARTLVFRTRIGGSICPQPPSASIAETIIEAFRLVGSTAQTWSAVFFARVIVGTALKARIAWKTAPAAILRCIHLAAVNTRAGIFHRHWYAAIVIPGGCRG